ncbi:MAG: hypothetical protein IJX60_03725 [Paludibacteraceae bacterium]|nr:hypothetical protein [Paludibacteraceae bacterium]MBQ9144038.1 hypothetical protein [Paludibacteraceae bacterium]
MNAMRISSNRITDLLPNEIFVFGSNIAGYHCRGAAGLALEKFGAIWGQGVGLQGQCYAIPTMYKDVHAIQPFIDEFLTFAYYHPELTFLVTEIGCGIAGFKPCDIAPLFHSAIERNLSNIFLPISFYSCY